MNISLLNNQQSKNVLVFGDFMIDKYVFGNVTRISPEAPVPIIEVKSKELRLGGAGNVVNNLVSLNVKCRVLGQVGDDQNGRYVISELEKKGVDTRWINLNYNYCTTIKTRIMSNNQQFLRCDEEEKKPLSDLFYNEIMENIDSIFEDVGLLIISDYNKGSVQHNISQFLIKEAVKKNIVIIVDPKGNDYSKYQGATICTPNTKELSETCGKACNTDEEVSRYGLEIQKKYKFTNVIVTRSEKGMTLVSGSEVEHFPTEAKDIVDVSGAGDTVVSALALSLISGFTVSEACIIANYAASIVISKLTTSTLNRDELIKKLKGEKQQKYITLAKAKSIANVAKNQGKTVVFTNGCFDLVHEGHISSFRKAKSKGDILIVAVNSDESVRKNKGDKRPIVDQDNRIKLLSAIEYIDFIVLMDDENPSNIIEEIQPDISVKGADWKGKEVPEEKVLKKYGGRLEYISLEEGLSTTNLIKKIVQAYSNE